MENERIAVSFDEVGGCRIKDQDTGFTFDCLKFEDVGDTRRHLQFRPGGRRPGHCALARDGEAAGHRPGGRSDEGRPPLAARPRCSRSTAPSARKKF
ncbi:MAG: hypothetical protein MZU95_15875 [Desulfomicrobium escambiense]|nr:hypothetical protein [Desulfomicrobium escambiense]